MSLNGFGGWLVVTPDPDWEQKRDTPPQTVPHFDIASEVRYRETLTILTFFINPVLDFRGEMSIRCDMQIVRPDASFSIDATGLDCTKGSISGDPRNIRLTSAIIEFIGEAGDQPGEWLIDINLYDENRDTKIPLKSSLRLVQ